MATIAGSERGVLQKERNFFLYMALALAGVTVIGFLRFLALGLSDFGEPWFVHVHGVSMMVWLALYVAQNGLVARGDLALHRRLGILAALWSVWVPLVGAMVLAFNTATARTPPFFSAEFMIALDGSCVAAFCALTWAGIALRGRTDWHKRLILCGTIALIQPGLGRLLPLSVLGSGIAYMLFPAHFLFLAVAAGHDLRLRGRIHPAYGLGLAVLVAMTLLPGPLAGTPPLTGLVAALKG